MQPELPFDGALPQANKSLIVDLHVRLDRHVDRSLGCHDNIAVIGEGRGPHAVQLRCIECGRHRGWLSQPTARFLSETVRLFGVPGEPFTIRDATPHANAGATAMANRNDLFPSKYLSAADLKGKTATLTMDRVTVEKFDNDGKTKQKPVLHFIGTAKTLILNATNYDLIADQHGDETDDWHGKKISVHPDTTDFKGKEVDCVRVTSNGAAKTKSKAEPNDDMSDEIPF